MAKAKKSAPETIKDICLLLKTFGITTIECEYDGSGDSGDINAISLVYGEPRLPSEVRRTETFHSFVHKNVTCVAEDKQIFTQKMATEFERALWDILREHFPGWEINEGSYGEIKITIENGKINLEHNERVTETITSHREL